MLTSGILYTAPIILASNVERAIIMPPPSAFLVDAVALLIRR